ncbi:MAG: hypothetical protein WKG01_00290 [Kofleriaceae bacterium]
MGDVDPLALERLEREVRVQLVAVADDGRRSEATMEWWQRLLGHQQVVVGLGLPGSAGGDGEQQRGRDESNHVPRSASGMPPAKRAPSLIGIGDL